MSALALNGCIFGGGGGGTTTGSSNIYDFSYDRLGQLIGVNVNETPSESYAFDPSGNLTSLTVGNTTTSFSSNNLNQQTAPGTHVYDAKGQKTTLDGKTFDVRMDTIQQRQLYPLSIMPEGLTARLTVTLNVAWGRGRRVKPPHSAVTMRAHSSEVTRPRRTRLYSCLLYTSPSPRD